MWIECQCALKRRYVKQTVGVTAFVLAPWVPNRLRSVDCKVSHVFFRGFQAIDTFNKLTRLQSGWRREPLASGDILMFVIYSTYCHIIHRHCDCNKPFDYVCITHSGVNNVEEWCNLQWCFGAPARISNYIHYKQWDEITYPFLNFNGVTVDV